LPLSEFPESNRPKPAVNCGLDSPQFFADFQLMLLRLHDIQAQYTPVLRLLRFQWHSTNPGLTHFQAALKQVAQLVEQGTVQAAIVDLHSLPNIDLEQQFWLTTTWLPQVSVPAIQHIALVLPDGNMYNQMVVESLIRMGRHFMHYDIQFFANAEEAHDWLLGAEQHAWLDMLRHEWNSRALPLRPPGAAVTYPTPVLLGQPQPFTGYAAACLPA
jgi:hypothetical protein